MEISPIIPFFFLTVNSFESSLLFELVEVFKGMRPVLQKPPDLAFAFFSHSDAHLTVLITAALSCVHR